MLLYEYPDKKTISDKRLEKIQIRKEIKKYKKNLLKSVIVSLMIIIISFFSHNAIIVLLLFIIALMSCLLSLFVYRYSVIQISDLCSTKIYDDCIVHTQPDFMVKKPVVFKIYYNNVERSYEDKIGNMIFILSNNYNNANSNIIDSNHKKTINTKKVIKISFGNSQPKNYIINNIYEKVKYNKKS